MKKWLEKWGLIAAIGVGVAFVLVVFLAPSDKAKSKPTASKSRSVGRHTPTPAEPRHHPLIQVVGFCASGRGSVFLHGEGFTPNGEYVTMAWGPGHKPYTRLHNPGVASAKGTTPDWEWPCEAVDRPGKYGVRLFDLESQTFSNGTGFEIYKP
jgi:hypothetical protein